MTIEQYNELLWWESLRERVEAGDTESALAAIDAAIKLIFRASGETPSPMRDRGQDIPDTEAGVEKTN